MLCPSCRETLDATTLSCPRGHRFGCEDGVLVLLDETFGRRLRAFAAGISAARAADGQRLPDPSIYPLLPDAPALRRSHEWRGRRHDVALLRRLLRGRRRVLDVGAWNGWLSNRLAELGHDVTAVDYFTDEFDGLRARKFYSTAWRAIQVDLNDLAVLDERFDAVVLNRCLAFAGDPQGFVAGARQLVTPGGLLVLTGLEIFRDPRAKARYVESLRRRHRDRHSSELFLAPTKGYLDFGDRARLAAMGLSLRPYPQLWAANLKALLRPSLPRHYYGVLPCP